MHKMIKSQVINIYQDRSILITSKYDLYIFKWHKINNSAIVFSSNIKHESDESYLDQIAQYFSINYNLELYTYKNDDYLLHNDNINIILSNIVLISSCLDEKDIETWLRESFSIIEENYGPINTLYDSLYPYFFPENEYNISPDIPSIRGIKYDNCFIFKDTNNTIYKFETQIVNNINTIYTLEDNVFNNELEKAIKKYYNLNIGYYNNMYILFKDNTESYYIALFNTQMIDTFNTDYGISYGEWLKYYMNDCIENLGKLYYDFILDNEITTSSVSQKQLLLNLYKPYIIYLKNNIIIYITVNLDVYKYEWELVENINFNTKLIKNYDITENNIKLASTFLSTVHKTMCMYKNELVLYDLVNTTEYIRLFNINFICRRSDSPEMNDNEWLTYITNGIENDYGTICMLYNTIKPYVLLSNNNIEAPNVYKDKFFCIMHDIIIFATRDKYIFSYTILNEVVNPSKLTIIEDTYYYENKVKELFNCNIYRYYKDLVYEINNNYYLLTNLQILYTPSDKDNTILQYMQLTESLIKTYGPLDSLYSIKISVPKKKLQLITNIISNPMKSIFYNKIVYFLNQNKFLFLTDKLEIYYYEFKVIDTSLNYYKLEEKEHILKLRDTCRKLLLGDLISDGNGNYCIVKSNVFSTNFLLFNERLLYVYKNYDPFDMDNDKITNINEWLFNCTNDIENEHGILSGNDNINELIEPILAKPTNNPWDSTHDIRRECYGIQEKFDGNRMLVRLNDMYMYTRVHTQININKNNNIYNILYSFRNVYTLSVTLDGELYKVGGRCTDVSGDINSLHSDFTGLVYNIFSYYDSSYTDLGLNEILNCIQIKFYNKNRWINTSCKDMHEEEYNVRLYKKKYNNFIYTPLNPVRILETWQLCWPDDIDKIRILYERAIQNNTREGLMLYVLHSPYPNNKSRTQCIKIKRFDQIRCSIINIISGKGNDTNLALFTIDVYGDNRVIQNVKPGLTHAQRNFIYNNKQMFISKIGVFRHAYTDTATTKGKIMHIIFDKFEDDHINNIIKQICKNE